MKKRAASELVATVLLIAAAISTGLIIFSFTRTTAEKTTTQIKMMTNQVECADIQLSIDSFNANGLTLKNRGTLGISDLVIRDYINEPRYSKDFSWTKDGSAFNWQTEKKLMPGVAIKTQSLDYNNINKLEIIPIIIVDGQSIGCENSMVIWK